MCLKTKDRCSINIKFAQNNIIISKSKFILIIIEINTQEIQLFCNRISIFNFNYFASNYSLFYHHLLYHQHVLKVMSHYTKACVLKLIVFLFIVVNKLFCLSRWYSSNTSLFTLVADFFNSPIQ